ncbi:MAG: hypothetical protein M1453_05035 [Acidobacteria bacterium]|nr:hypothetical protein [Acidobacteriota bacterium]MCL5287344.1 hypothetical protein [Acidobacteriota bacterium]
MADVFFFGLFFVVSLTFIAHGLLMLLSPPVHSRFLNWWAQSDKWLRPKDVALQSQERGIQIEKRIVGFVLLLIGLYAVRVPIKWFMGL